MILAQTVLKEIVLNYQHKYKDRKINYFKHSKNKGKGAALHTGIKHANGDYIIVQDADLEFDPEEYNVLLRPIVNGFCRCCLWQSICGWRGHIESYSSGIRWATNS